MDRAANSKLSLRSPLKSWSTSKLHHFCICLDCRVAAMSGGIEEPYSIAALPKPLDSEHGRILGANVYSLSGSKKRKRREVAVGVDGESVNIYNVRMRRHSRPLGVLILDRSKTRRLRPHTLSHRSPTLPLRHARYTAEERSHGSRRGKHILLYMTEEMRIKLAWLV